MGFKNGYICIYIYLYIYMYTYISKAVHDWKNTEPSFVAMAELHRREFPSCLMATPPWGSSAAPLKVSGNTGAPSAPNPSISTGIFWGNP